MEDFLNVFAERLRSLRLEKNLSLQELAEMVGTVKSTISQYENCKREPVLSILIKLSNALEVDISYLIGESDTRK
jgi:transcriptional regulator with XRE-family HTH domain